MHVSRYISQYSYIPPYPYPTIAIATQWVSLLCSGTIRKVGRHLITNKHP